MEKLSRQKHIDLFYGDTCQVSEQGYVPYAWQFPGQEVFIPAAKGKAINCWALISRDNRIHYTTTYQSVDAQFVLEQLEELSWGIKRLTVVVLDNAGPHVARKIKERLKYWEQRGLFIFYLPPYSPHLNIAETLWRKLKYEWLHPDDYFCTGQLFFSVTAALAAVGSQLAINFSEFNLC